MVNMVNAFISSHTAKWQDILLAHAVINAGSLQMSYWKLQQCGNCKSKLRRNHYMLYLAYPRYHLYRHITATSTFMLPRPIATISYSKYFTTTYHNIRTQCTVLNKNGQATGSVRNSLLRMASTRPWQGGQKVLANTSSTTQPQNNLYLTEHS
jgi:hypothetical protein